jgi:hypothetical protein
MRFKCIFCLQSLKLAPARGATHKHCKHKLRYKKNNMQLEGQLRPDHWHVIGRHLSVVDLCRLMQVSRDWFHLWIADRAWAHQRRRVCTRFPSLNDVFELYCDGAAANEHTSKRTQKSNSNKKRKTAWITPKKGVWYVFKRWLMQGTHMKGIKALCKIEEMHPIVISVVCLNLPCNELITKTKIRQERDAGGLQNSYEIVVRWEGCQFICYLHRLIKGFWRHCFYVKADPRFFGPHLYECGIVKEHVMWGAFLFERNPLYSHRWSDLFENLIKDGGR